MALHPLFVLGALSAAFRTSATASIRADDAGRSAARFGTLAVAPKQTPVGVAPEPAASAPQLGAAASNDADRSPQMVYRKVLERARRHQASRCTAPETSALSLDARLAATPLRTAIATEDALTRTTLGPGPCSP